MFFSYAVHSDLLLSSLHTFKKAAISPPPGATAAQSDRPTMGAIKKARLETRAGALRPTYPVERLRPPVRLRPTVRVQIPIF